MSWTAPFPPEVTGPMTGPDRPMLVALLGWHRRTLLAICAGLTAEQLAARPVEPSTLSLLGLVRHLTKVERIWLRERAAGQVLDALFDPADGKDADFEQADAAAAPDDFARYHEEIALADEAVAGLDLEHGVERHGGVVSLRFVYLHLIGEYARHNGHADLLRERLDGTTGR